MEYEREEVGHRDHCSYMLFMPYPYGYIPLGYAPLFNGYPGQGPMGGIRYPQERYEPQEELEEDDKMAVAMMRNLQLGMTVSWDKEEIDHCHHQYHVQHYPIKD